MTEFRDLSARADSALAGQRFDQALAQAFDLSRRRIRRVIDEGGAYLNGKRTRTAGRTVKPEDRLRIVLLEQEKLLPLSSEQLIWRDESLYLLHKRSGQYAQEALHRSQGTLPVELAALLELPPARAGLLRPVHRLDRGTSGLMLFCDEPVRLQQLQKHWHDAAGKRYIAVVDPAPAWDEQHIRLAIGTRRDRHGCYAVDENGRACDSEARVTERKGNRAMVELVPHTGRTHQLRVHLAALGCPILGDPRYGGKPHTRLMLHACDLALSPPAMPEPHAWHVDPEEDWRW